MTFDPTEEPIVTVADEPVFRINRVGGVNTLHIDEYPESCESDQSMTIVDEWTAEALLAREDAVACLRCRPIPRG